MGATSSVKLWGGILAGPAAWALDLFVSYAIVKWTCYHDHHWLFDAFTVCALAIVAGGATLSWNGLRGARDQTATFMATLGLASSALFALQIAAAWFPRWVLDACR